MPEKIIDLKIDAKQIEDVPVELNIFTYKHIPFAMSKTLNEIGKIWGQRMSLNASAKLNIRRAWSRRYVRGRVSKGPDWETNTAAFYSTQVKYTTPLAKMYVRARTNSWQMAQQTDDVTARRTPESVTLINDSGRAVEYLAIPIPANLKHKQGIFSPNANHLIRHAKTERAFLLPSKNDPALKLLFQRYGNGQKDYKLLYLLVESVQITPKFSFTNTLEQVFNETFDQVFKEQMEYALKTAKK